ncbi:MAG: pseudouridine synthase [Microscillaceae bacterium]|nr:pseudouridine synthase [Microscillaceae bacterium]MDW8461254.1 pseudouridine synthase [Cytophagales bacterium]
MKQIDLKNLIIFENEDYFVVNKPPYVSTLDERIAKEGKPSIIRLAREYCSSAQVCHRLDKETSGAIAIAKNAKAYRHLAMQFEARQVGKIYHAVVNGIHNFEDVAVNMPILPLKTGIVQIDYRAGKEALTFFKTVKAFSQHTLVKCMPLTGRMHQIRIHLSVLKAPIVADELYGGKPIFLSEIKKRFKLKQDTEEQPLIKRAALHAFSLIFKDLQGNEIIAEAPYPKDMEALLNQLEKWA